jgi:uncharacterized protein
MLAASVLLASIASIASSATLTNASHRPQEEAIAENPRPYVDQEVTFFNIRGAVKLLGILSLPDGEGPFPGVVLLAASGPEDRDEDVVGHKVFVVLADYLLRQGIAVLRYDKRGVGHSGGQPNQSTFEDRVSDAEVASRYLRNSPGINPRKVGIVGHSEGGSIAPAVAAADPDVSFVVAMAGSGLSGEFRVTQMQVTMAQLKGATPQQQSAIRDLSARIFRVVAENKDDAVASQHIDTLIDEAVKAHTLDGDAAEATRQIMTPSFVREALSDHPIDYLKKVHVPVLALVGSLDQTVPSGPYVEAMNPVLQQIPGSQVRVLPGLNHVMQTARTGSPAEFATLDETISPVALTAIGEWIKQQTSR